MPTLPCPDKIKRDRSMSHTSLDQRSPIVIRTSSRTPHRRSITLVALACFTVCGQVAVVSGAVLASGPATVAEDPGHHGDHHLEIGHNAPAGVAQKDFESPAWFQKDLAIWSFAVFLALLALLTKFAWKPIMQGLEKREEGIARQIAETKASNEEAKRMLASYERRLAEASEEVRGMLEEARRDADATRQAIVAEARKAAEEERARATHEIHLAKDDALSQIAEKAGQLAIDVAGKFLREKLGQDDQSRLVRESVASLSSRPSVN